MRKITAGAILFCLLPFLVEAQEIIDLYSGPIPNSKVKASKETDPPVFRGMYRKSAFPTLEVYLATRQNPPERRSSFVPEVAIVSSCMRGKGYLPPKN